MVMNDREMAAGLSVVFPAERRTKVIGIKNHADSIEIFYEWMRRKIQLEKSLYVLMLCSFVKRYDVIMKRKLNENVWFIRLSLTSPRCTLPSRMCHEQCLSSIIILLQYVLPKSQKNGCLCTPQMVCDMQCKTSVFIFKNSGGFWRDVTRISMSRHTGVASQFSATEGAQFYR